MSRQSSMREGAHPSAWKSASPTLGEAMGVTGSIAVAIFGTVPHAPVAHPSAWKYRIIARTTGDGRRSL